MRLYSLPPTEVSTDQQQPQRRTTPPTGRYSMDKLSSRIFLCCPCLTFLVMISNVGYNDIFESNNHKQGNQFPRNLLKEAVGERQNTLSWSPLWPEPQEKAASSFNLLGLSQLGLPGEKEEDDSCGSVQLFGLHTRAHGGARQSCHNLHYLLYSDQTQTHCWMINSMPCFTDLPVRTKVSLNPNIAYHLLGLLQG